MPSKFTGSWGAIRPRDPWENQAVMADASTRPSQEIARAAAFLSGRFSSRIFSPVSKLQIHTVSVKRATANSLLPARKAVRPILRGAAHDETHVLEGKYTTLLSSRQVE